MKTAKSSSHSTIVCIEPLVNPKDSSTLSGQFHEVECEFERILFVNFDQMFIHFLTWCTCNFHTHWLWNYSLMPWRPSCQCCPRWRDPSRLAASCQTRQPPSLAPWAPHCNSLKSWLILKLKTVESTLILPEATQPAMALIPSTHCGPAHLWSIGWPWFTKS